MEICALCDAVAADRRQNPRDDIMTALVQAELDGERLDDLELNLFFVTLVVAGNETTRNLINHSMLALIEHRSEEHTSELQSLMRISYAVFCLKKKKHYQTCKRTVSYLNYINIQITIYKSD